MKNWIKKFIKKRFKRYYFLRFPWGLLFVNFVFQRILRINSKCKFVVHFTSKVYVGGTLLFPKNDRSILTSFAVSGSCYFTVFPNTTLEIGEGTIWSYNVAILTSNHDVQDRNKAICKDVKIGKNCWFGKGVTILAGVTLGDNVTVGANSVVTKSFESNVVIAGCPAKVIKEL